MLSDLFRQQAIPKFKNVYVRLGDLEQISKEEVKANSLADKFNGQGTNSVAKHILTCSQHATATKPGERDGQRIGGTSPDSYFCRMLEQELARIRRFAESFAEELWVRLGTLSDLVARLQKLAESANGKQKDSIPKEKIDILTKECDEMGEDVILLDEFLRQNVIAAAFVAQRHDSQLGVSNLRCPNSLPQIAPAYLQAIETYFLGALQYDSLVVGFSDIYSSLRQLRNSTIHDEAIWKAPDKFHRKTTKFWVHPGDVLRIKCNIVRHLPVLIYGKQKTCGGPKTRLSLLKDQKINDWTQISSVYFDSEDLGTYEERLRREHNASLVRIRWYGKRNPAADQQMFVERKIHKESWTGEDSVKERAPLAAQQVSAFIQGAHAPALDDEGHTGKLLKDIQQRLVSRSEKPIDRTEYHRVAFQESTTNEVRISLDTHLRMVREKDAITGSSGWCRDMSAKIQPKDVVNFPYAVLELKLTTEDPPDWVQDVLLNSGMLVEVPKFSKFLHGTALLFGDKVRNSPFWFLPSSQGHWTPATLEEMADTYDKYEKESAGFLFPSVNCGLRDKSRKSLAPVASNASPSPQKMQVSTLYSVPNHTTVLSEVVVMPSSEGDGQTHQVVCTSMQNSNGGLQKLQGDGIVPDWQKTSKLRMSGKGPSDRELSKALLSENTGKPGKPPNPGSSDMDSQKHSTRAEALVRTRIEPKTFFANERTFLAWITIAVMVMFMGLSLLDGSGLTAAGGTGEAGNAKDCDGRSCLGSKVSGALICPVAIMFMVYALYMYRKRSIQILRRETVRYDDERGPMLLTLLLVTVLLTAFAVSLTYNL